jgi:putative MATE family efflux protein
MKDFTVGNEARLILRFSAPLVMANIFQNLYNIVDSIIVGNVLGKEALAAVGASFPIIFTLISLIIGIGSGAATVVSQYFGARDILSVKRTIDSIFIVFFVSSVLVSVTGITLSEQIFRLLKLPDEVMPDALSYLNIYLSGMFFFFGFSGISSILRGLGDSKTPLYYMMIATVSNIVLDLLFIIVFRWGIEGAAIATVLSQAGAFATAIWHLNRKHEIINLSFRKYVFDRQIFNSCVRIGLPTGIQQSLIAIGMMAILSIVNRFGTNAVAAYSAAIRIDSFVKMPAIAFSSALSSFVGQNLGAFHEKRAISGLRATIVFSIIYCIAITLVIVFFGDTIMLFFTSDAQVIQIGEDYLIIVSLFYLLFSVMFSLTGFLRGAGDTFIPMIATLISLYIVRIPAATFLSNLIGVNGIWWSEPAGWFIGLAIMVVYFRTGRWRGKVVVKK